ncbi:hypothetical protein RHSIM_Rhsim04G0233000 [Rhododendron simsii]|uniref:Uncharacterized protein n=1 Tax=Rhododendron simsii TaxID=118357 RepID=A0A834H2G3_RHOSS|nr:hypothetical protein RHSIM_Rhsim04G0233000 [Rhododendron simsii]
MRSGVWAAASNAGILGLIDLCRARFVYGWAVGDSVVLGWVWVVVIGRRDGGLYGDGFTASHSTVENTAAVVDKPGVGDGIRSPFVNTLERDQASRSTVQNFLDGKTCLSPDIPHDLDLL